MLHLFPIPKAWPGTCSSYFLDEYSFKSNLRSFLVAPFFVSHFCVFSHLKNTRHMDLVFIPPCVSGPGLFIQLY